MSPIRWPDAIGKCRNGARRLFGHGPDIQLWRGFVDWLVRPLLPIGLAMGFVMIGLPLLTDLPDTGFPLAAALADDDDNSDDGDGDDSGGGDDDGGSSGGGGDDVGGSGDDSGGGDEDVGGGDDDDGEDSDNDDDGEPARSNGATGPAPIVDKASQRDGYSAAREILAIDANPEALRNLEAAGFVARERRNLSALQVSINRLTIPPSLSLPAALARARQIAPGVAYEPNPVYRISDDGQQAGPEITEEVAQRQQPRCEGSECYSFEMVGWPNNPGRCGDGLRIGMTDTAIDRDHPALRNQIVQPQSFAAVGPERRSPTDHGTAMAALLVGDPASGFAGMLPAASLYAADVFHLDGGGQPQATLTDLVNGLDWLAGQQVSVINISMTGPPNRLLESAIQTLDGRGIGIVSAAGNGGPTAAPAFPAAYDSVVSVTAIGQDLRIYRLANRGDYIAFASPGVDIWSAGEGRTGRYRTGTSVAAAHVSAAIAEILGEHGTDLSTALRMLRRDARDLGAPGHDPIFGWGLLQASPTCRG